VSDWFLTISRDGNNPAPVAKALLAA